MKYLMPRDVAQMLIEKLDRRHITLADAKQHVKRIYYIELKSRTYDKMAREIGQLIRD